MASFSTVVWSSIGKKITIALVGLFLFFFLVVHLIGNLLMLAGPEAYNDYAHKLASMGAFTWTFRAVLLVGFLLHVAWTLRNYVGNRDARPERYHLKHGAGGTSRKSLASTSMILGGLFLLVFVPIHVWTMAVAEKPLTAAGIPDVYAHAVKAFQNPLTVVWYSVVMGWVGFHVWHGFSSAFQSLGADHPKYTPIFRRLGWFFGIVLGGGFFILPILTIAGVINSGQ